MSSNAIHIMVQKAVAQYLGQFTFSWVNNAGEDATPTILRGITASAKVLPAVIVECSQAAHEDVGTWTGNWWANVEIRVRENADDVSEDLHLEHAGAVFDLIVTDSIAQDIDNLTGSWFTVQKVNPGSASYAITGRSWESSLSLVVFCSGSASPFTYTLYSYDMGPVTESVVEVIDMEA